MPAVLLCAQQIDELFKKKKIFLGNYRGVEKPFSNYKGNIIIVASHKYTVQKVYTECVVCI